MNINLIQNVSSYVSKKTLATHTIEVDNLPSSIDILLLTVTNKEFNAVFQYLEPLPGQNKIIYRFIDNNCYYVGCYESYTVVLIAIFGAGMANAMNYIHEALKLFSCQLIINVGIAWGADPNKHRMGDVLVANQVVNIDNVKKCNGQIIQRGASPVIDSRTNAIISTSKMRWPDDEKSQVHIGLYIGSNTLLNDPDEKKIILEKYPEAIGGEMESFAIYEASNFNQIPWVIIKGVSDWADGEKHDQYHDIATANAAKFLYLMCQTSKNLITRSEKKTLEHKDDIIENKSVIYYRHDNSRHAKQHLNSYNIEEDTCYRCHYDSHFATDCYANKDVDGNSLEGHDVCYRCGRNEHFAKKCYARTNIYGNRFSNAKNSIKENLPINIDNNPESYITMLVNFLIDVYIDNMLKKLKENVNHDIEWGFESKILQKQYKNRKNFYNIVNSPPSKIGENDIRVLVNTWLYCINQEEPHIINVVIDCIKKENERIMRRVDAKAKTLLNDKWIHGGYYLCTFKILND